MNTCKSYLKIMLSGTCLVAGFQGSEAVSEPYLECQPYYQLYTNCLLNSETDYAAPYEVQFDGEMENVHSEYRFEYRFTCRERKLPLNWTTGDEQKLISQSHEWKKASIEGTGSFAAQQADSSRRQTLREVYQDHCKLQVRDLEVLPSRKTMTGWRKDLVSLSGRVADAVYTLDKINDIIMFKSAFVFLGEMNTLFLEELSAEERKYHSEEFQRRETLFQGMVENTSGVLNDEEVQAVKVFVGIFKTLGEESMWTHEDGSPKSLSDFISDDEQKVMKILQERVNGDEDYHEQRLNLYRKINGWNEKIQTIQKLLQEWQGAHT